MKTKLVILTTFLFLLNHLFAQNKVVAWWNFDYLDNQTIITESCSRLPDTLTGFNKLIPGISNKALKLDEFSSSLKHKPTTVLNSSFSVIIWLAVQTYPWNWCPIIEQKDSASGFFFGIDYQGRIGFRLRTDKGWFECLSRPAITGLDETVMFAGESGNKRKKAHFPENTYPDPLVKLLQWNHLVATYDADNNKISIYLNGTLQGETTTPGKFIPASNKDFYLFRSSEKQPLMFLARPKANNPVYTSLDGCVDELKILNYSLPIQEIKEAFTAEKPLDIQPLKFRRMPTAQDKPGKFGAFYTNLNYDEDWDRTRRMGASPDVVVRFTNNPCTFVAWNGTIYPIMYNETGNAGQQFEAFETWNGNGCNEAMMDKINRYTSWKIVENNEARIVLHWRHCLVAFNNQYIHPDDVSGWSDWVDDYYYIYPDYVIARKTTLWSSNPTSNFSYAQDNSVMQPEFMPWDIYEKDPMTVANLKGQVSTMGMGKDKAGKVNSDFEMPAQIQLHNFKSAYKPFMIAPPAEKMMGVWTNDEPWPWFLPCWHHWPTAQIQSDGASTFVNNGRPKSSCLTNGWGYGAINKDAVVLTPNSLTRFSLIGMTNKPASSLVPLAKSWHKAPELEIASKGFVFNGYNFEDRSYCIQKEVKNPVKLRLKVQATTERPTTNMAIVMLHCKTNNLSLWINNRKLKEGEEFTYGNEKNLDGDNTVIWINYSSEKAFRLDFLFK